MTALAGGRRSGASATETTRRTVLTTSGRTVQSRQGARKRRQPDFGPGLRWRSANTVDTLSRGDHFPLVETDYSHTLLTPSTCPLSRPSSLSLQRCRCRERCGCIVGRRCALGLLIGSGTSAAFGTTAMGASPWLLSSQSIQDPGLAQSAEH